MRLGSDSLLSSILIRMLTNYLKKITKICTLFLFIILITGCSQSTPSTTNFEDFIYAEPVKQEITNTETNQTFTFKTDHFPHECDWRDLGRIVDGDTLWVNNPGEKVRFIGIDTPEIKHPRKPFDPKGLVASDYLKKLLKDEETICLIKDDIGDKRDRYDRLLAYLFRADGLDINAEMIRSGNAKWYPNFPYERKEEFRVLYEQIRAKIETK